MLIFEGCVVFGASVTEEVVVIVMGVVSPKRADSSGVTGGLLEPVITLSSTFPLSSGFFVDVYICKNSAITLGLWQCVILI